MDAPRRETYGQIKGGRFHVPDLFEILNAIRATALCRCWHLMLFFTAWSTMVTALNNWGYAAHTESSLLTVIGTVLGFAISYRTTSAFERYYEGRKLWSDMILATRNFARNVWLHAPDPKPLEGQSPEQVQAMVLLEKKTVMNVLEAFAFAVKHHLRREDGIYYHDLYHKVKYLPLNARPTRRADSQYRPTDRCVRSHRQTTDQPYQGHSQRPTDSHKGCQNTRSRAASLHRQSHIIPQDQEANRLLPARNPTKYRSKKAERWRAKLRSMKVSQNLPLELTFYLSSYIAALQRRDVCDHPTIANLTAALNMLVESFTGLERILTTPIPFSYAAHLWSVTTIYCLLLPSMVWTTLRWLTIPATGIVTFLFFGFLVAAGEIENPFGYDKNDLNLDHFTNDIIKKELRDITSNLPPDVSIWAFVEENDCIFSDQAGNQRVSPSEWLRRGTPKILRALRDHDTFTAPENCLDTPAAFFGAEGESYKSSDPEKDM